MSEPTNLPPIKSDSRALVSTVQLAAIVMAVAAVGGLAVWFATNRSAAPEPGAVASSDVRKVHGLGESIFTGNFAIVVRAERRGTVGTRNAQSIASRGMTYVAVRYDLTNTSDNPISTLSFPRVELIAASGTRHRPDAAISAAYARQIDGDTKFRNSLGARETSREVAVFEVNEAVDLAGWRLALSENNRETLVSLLPATPGESLTAARVTLPEKPAQYASPPDTQASADRERLAQAQADERARAEAKARDEEARAEAQALAERQAEYARAEQQAREEQARAEQEAREEQARAEAQAREEQQQAEEQARVDREQARSDREQSRVERAMARQQARLERREQARAEWRAWLEERARQRRERAAEAERNARSWNDDEDDDDFGYDDNGGNYDDEGSPDGYSWNGPDGGARNW